MTLLGHLTKGEPLTLPDLGRLTSSSIRVGEVAPNVHQLEEAGLLMSYSMEHQGRFYQITELGRKIHALYHRFDLERMLSPARRALVRRLGTGRWLSEKGLREELALEIQENDFQREMEVLYRVGLVEQRNHPRRFGVREYRLSELGQEVLAKDHEVLAVLERIAGEFDD